MVTAIRRLVASAGVAGFGFSNRLLHFHLMLFVFVVEVARDKLLLLARFAGIKDEPLSPFAGRPLPLYRIAPRQ